MGLLNAQAWRPKSLGKIPDNKDREYLSDRETRWRFSRSTSQAASAQNIFKTELESDSNPEHTKSSKAVEHLQLGHFMNRPPLRNPWSIPETGLGSLDKYEILMWDFKHMIKNNVALTELRCFLEHRIYNKQEQLNILNLFQLVLIYGFTIAEDPDPQAPAELIVYVKNILSDFRLEDKQEEILDLLVDPKLWGFLIESGQGYDRYMRSDMKLHNFIYQMSNQKNNFDYKILFNAIKLLREHIINLGNLVY